MACPSCKLKIEKLELDPKKKYLIRIGDEKHEPDMLIAQSVADAFFELKLNAVIVPFFINAKETSKINSAMLLKKRNQYILRKHK